MKNTKRVIATVLAVALIVTGINVAISPNGDFISSVIPQFIKRVLAAGTVGEDLSETETPYKAVTDGDNGDMNLFVDKTDYKFMQIEDSQRFSINQLWQFEVTGGNNNRVLYGITLDEQFPLYCRTPSAGNCKAITENKTADFLNRADKSTFERINILDEDDRRLKNIAVFNNWKWVQPTSNPGNKNFIKNGKPAHDYKLEKGLKYQASVNPIFVGRGANEYGPLDLQFVQRTGWYYYIGAWSWQYRHFHIPTTVTVTDARSLVKAYNEAQNKINNPKDYSPAYIEALKGALNSVPKEAVEGRKFLDQSTVDKLTYDLENVSTNPADYSRYDAVYESLIKLPNNGNYLEDSFNNFKKTVEKVNLMLDRTLDATQQSIVDAATENLKTCFAELIRVDAKAASGQFSSTDIKENMGNSCIDFTLKGTEFKYMQVIDNQKFYITTELRAKKTRNNYTLELYTPAFSRLKSGDTLCAQRPVPDEGCHNLNNVTENDCAEFINKIVGNVEIYPQNSNYVTEIGSLGEATSWVHDSTSVGASIVENGKIKNGVQLSLDDHKAKAEIIFKGIETPITDNPTAYKTSFAWRLGWGYRENFFFSKQAHRHAHIPVTITITDARALAKKHLDAKEILDSKGNQYTKESLAKLEKVYKSIPLDMVEGTSFYTQEEVNTQEATIATALKQVENKADYSDYNKKLAEIEKITNTDGRYTEEEFKAFKDSVASIDSALNKDLPNNAESKKLIDGAIADLIEKTQGLKNNYKYFITYKNEDGKVLKTDSFKKGSAFSHKVAPKLPDDTEIFAYVGWLKADGTIMGENELLGENDVELTLCSELKKIILKNETMLISDNTVNYVGTIKDKTSVSNAVKEFENEEKLLEIKSYDGRSLPSEDFVGTGSTVTLKSKYTGEIYDQRVFIIAGDVNGDGIIDKADFSTSNAVSIGAKTYEKSQEYFFVANDANCDGVIDVLDSYYISKNMS